MATLKGQLQHGFKIGETLHLDYELREVSAGDILDAMEESEKLVMVPGDRPRPELVASPTLVGVNTLRRQIVRLGTYPGPLTLVELKRLHPADLGLLQTEAELLEAGAAPEAAQRGRADRGQG